MRVNVVNHFSWFILPTVQWTPAHCGLEHWPWTLVVWWGKHGIQIEGSGLGEEVKP